jgi:CheY-like chemotaxis protein
VMGSSKDPEPSGAPRILLVGDSPDTVEETRALVKDIRGKLVAISEPDRIVAAFDEVEPQILLLAFMEVGEAEGCYLDLYRSSQKIQTTAHNSLLVCKAKDAELAYRLCMRKLFDDYVVIRPLYDPFRLSVCIRNLLAGQETVDQSAELRQQLASIRNSTSAMDGFIRESLAEGANVRTQLVQSGKQLNQRILESLHGLVEEMASSTFDGVVRVDNWTALNERFSRFAQKNLSGEVLAAFEKPQAALNQLLKRSESDFMEHTQANANLDAWLNSVPTCILVVDDDPVYLSIITRMLASESFEVVTTTNPIEGLSMAARLRPAAILVDYEMPEMSGLDFIARARAAPRLHQVPIIMLTGHAERNVVQHALAAGVSGYLIKPGTKETLLKKLHRAIGQGRKPEMVPGK